MCLVLYHSILSSYVSKLKKYFNRPVAGMIFAF
jgi:hypothetical protein